MQSRDSRDGQLARNPADMQTGAGFVVDGKMQAFEAGDVIGGSYEIIEQLGRGAMGMVFKARHTTMGTVYALKVMGAEQLTDVGVRRFQNEAQAIAKLNHPNVIRIYNFGLHLGQLPFYVMDLLQGENLLDKVIEYGPVPVQHCMPIFIEACAGLGYAHRKGILHRDVKPANLVLLDNPDVLGARVKVVDFGIVKFAEEVANAQKLTAMGDVCGSPTYMSPEQAAGAKVDPRSDIYSLGVSLYECLTGNLPFRGRNPMETMMMHHTTPAPSLKVNGQGREYPDALEYVVAKTLQKEPMDRYQSMDALAQDLKNVLLGAPVGTPQNLGELFGHGKGGTAAGSAGHDSDVRTTTTTGAPNIRNTAAPSSSAADEIALRFNSRASSRFERSSDGTLKGRDDEDYDYDAPPAGFNAIKLVVIPFVAVTLLGVLAYFIYTAMTPKQAADPAQYNKPLKDLTNVKDTARFLPQAEKSGGKVDFSKIKYFAKRDDAEGTITFSFPLATDENFVANIAAAPGRFMPCSGILTFDKKDEVRLSPNPSAKDNPDFFKKFRPGDIYELNFSADFDGDNDAIFQTATALPGFKKISFYGCQNFTPAIFKRLASLSNLEALEVTSGSLDGPYFARLSYIENLKKVGLVRFKNIAPLLEKLARSTKLDKLMLDDCELKDGDYKLLGENRSITKLSLRNNKVSRKQLAMLTKMKQVEVLEISGNNLGPSNAAVIAQLPNLKELDINAKNFNFDDSKTAVKNWRAALPGVLIRLK